MNTFITNKTAALKLHNDAARNTQSDKQLNQLHREYLQAATSENTRRTYRSAIKHFQRWGGALPCKSNTVINYLLHHAQSLNTRTLEVRLTAISQWHQYQGFIDPTKSPTVHKTLEGIRRRHGHPKRKAKALRPEHIAIMVKYLMQPPVTKKKVRDLALIQLGFFGGFRRSELVAIEVGHLHWEPEGIIVQLSRSKTDQEGMGILRAIPKGTGILCPVLALQNWLEIAKIEKGVLFKPINRWDKIQLRALNASAINELLKLLGKACGFDFTSELSSHSLRRGLSTSAAREQVSFESIKKQGGWKSDATVWEYIDEGKLFNNNAARPLIEKISKLLET